MALTVTDADTAPAWRTGTVPVLATPRVVALCEEAACAALAARLGPGETTVGSRVQVDHLAPVRVGTTVRASATLERIDGRRYTLTVGVTDGCGVVAAGRITRVLVDADRFLERAR